MAAIDDKMLNAVEKTSETILKNSEGWGWGQKIAAAIVCLLAGAALVTGVDSFRLSGGVAVALFGISFLTFRRRVIESETLVLKDRNGKARIALSASGGLVFFDDNGHGKIVVNTFSDQPVIHLTTGTESLLIMGASVNLVKNDLSGPTTALSRGTILLGSPTGPTVTLSSRETASALLMDADKRFGVALAADASSATASVGELKGARVFVSGTTDGNLGLMMQYDDSPSLILGSGRQHAGHLSFFGEGGRRMASYPE